MSLLDDAAVERLRSAADWPDLSGTKYRILRRIARGGMGTIYAALDGELGREVALKVLSETDPSGDLSARLRSEAMHLARLEHPNIVPVHDAGILPDGRAYYVMKLVVGKGLHAWRGEGRSLRELLGVYQKVCEAVAFAHAHGVIHRDLKPDNVMIGAFGEALVMDWGVAKRIAGRGLSDPDAQVTLTPGAAGGSVEAAPPFGGTAHGTVVGTPAYMAPEQARGDVERLDSRTDVYALGALLHHLLSGAPPFTGADAREVLSNVLSRPPSPLRQIDRTIPRALESIASKAMSRRPSDRYATASEVAADVARYLDGRPVTAHPENLLERTGRLLNNHKTLILLVFAYLLMRLVVLAAVGR